MLVTLFYKVLSHCKSDGICEQVTTGYIYKLILVSAFGQKMAS